MFNRAYGNDDGFPWEGVLAAGGIAIGIISWILGSKREEETRIAKTANAAVILTNQRNAQELAALHEWAVNRQVANEARWSALEMLGNDFTKVNFFNQYWPEVSYPSYD